MKLLDVLTPEELKETLMQSTGDDNLPRLTEEMIEAHQRMAPFAAMVKQLVIEGRLPSFVGVHVCSTLNMVEIILMKREKQGVN